MDQYFAKIDTDGSVADIRCVEQSYLEANKELYDGEWIETWRNGWDRKNFGVIGSKYDREKDAFIPQRPYPSWNLNESTCKWEPPIPIPETGSKYEWVWNEQLLTWVNISSNP